VATAELAGLTVLHVDENFEPVDRAAEPEQVLHDCHAGAPQTAGSDNRHWPGSAAAVKSDPT
jgi:hypothetical protein